MYDPAKMPLPKNYLPQHPFDNGEMAVRDEKLAPWPRTPEVVRRHLCDYYGMVSCHDAQVGRVLKALEDTGQIDNTIIVFTADHGLALGQHGLFGKQNVYEHSVSIPLVLCGPGIPKGKSDALVYGFDVCPTILELAGAPVPETVEGKSLVPLMAGRQVKLRDSAFFAYQKWQRAVRDDRWKLIRYPQVDKTQLFDLQNDPWETTDLAAAPQHAAKVKEMTALLVKWQGELGDTLPLTVADPKNPDWSPPGGNGGGGKAAGAGGGKKGKQQKANP
jgi:arylsulfatase A-like enzyme